MRTLFGIILLATTLVSPLYAQESKKGFELNFSLVHPAKWGLSEYKFSADPTLEVLYFTSLSEKFWVAGGIYAQAGKHNWLELYGHTFVDDFGIPNRLRTDYSRQLEFFSVGIPVKIGMNCKSAVFNSLFLGFTAGNHLKLEKADYYESEFVATFPVYPYYNSVFWELNFGLRKTLFKKENFTVSLSPVAGYRKESPKRFHAMGRYDYFFFGLGVNSRLGR
ncbi:MAG: hypothetical protein K0B11_11965 [Mariniphaga sp.]|nr:hypothetical protein [Mariniphaga sp.]